MIATKTTVRQLSAGENIYAREDGYGRLWTCRPDADGAELVELDVYQGYESESGHISKTRFTMIALDGRPFGANPVRGTIVAYRVEQATMEATGAAMIRQAAAALGVDLDAEAHKGEIERAAQDLSTNLTAHGITHEPMMFCAIVATPHGRLFVEESAMHLDGQPYALRVPMADPRAVDIIRDYVSAPALGDAVTLDRVKFPDLAGIWWIVDSAPMPDNTRVGGYAPCVNLYRWGHSGQVRTAYLADLRDVFGAAR